MSTAAEPSRSRARRWRVLGLVLVPIGVMVMLLPSLLALFLSSDLAARAFEVVCLGGSLAASGLAIVAATRGAGRRGPLGHAAALAGSASILLVGAAFVCWAIEAIVTANSDEIVYDVAPLDAVSLLVRLAVIFAAVAAAAATILVMMRVPLTTTVQRAVRSVAVGAVASMLCIAIPLVAVPFDPQGDSSQTLFGVLAIALICVAIPGGSAMLATFGMARAAAARRGRRGESIAESIRLELECPRCGAAMTVPTGASSCPSCKVVLLVEVEEPRCECGYSLYTLGGDTCPECGRAVETVTARRNPDT